MQIYTIIVTYNGMQWIDRCLQSLRDSTLQTTPIIIDNCSKDNTFEHIKTNYPEAILFPQQENLGFGQANNVGMKYALEHGADYMILLNQDASFEKTSIEKVIQQSDSKSLLSPIHLNGTGDKIDPMFKISLLQANNKLLDDLIINSVQPKYKVGEFCAACWILPRQIVEEIGGFNPLFFHYGEDNNYYQRLIYHGIKSYIVPAARMYHDREVHGNVQAYNNKLLRRRLLIIISDINLSYSDRIYKYIKILKTCYIDNLIKGKYLPGVFTYTMIKLLLNNRKILFSKAIDRREGRNWL